MSIKGVLPFLSEGDGKENASSSAVKQADKGSEEGASVSSEAPEEVASQGSGRGGISGGKGSHVAPPELRGPGYIIGKGLRDNKPIRLPAEGRIHSLVVGKSGTGKTTFMLTQMLQDAEKGHSVFVFDPQGDLAERFMSFLPEDRLEDVVYVNPTTHHDYEEGVVKFNFLSFKKIRQADLETDAFMGPLHKLYSDFWGPRLEGIMRNGINLLRDSKKDFTLFKLANILSNDSERDALLHDADEHQRRFWKHDFEKMPQKAPTAALTKMYKLTQSETLRPMIDTTYSTVDLYDCMQKGKIIIFDLRTSQLAGGYPEFLGSLFLARLTMLGMVRQEIPKEDRTPVHVYADEAHRFVTETIADNMRALRKYNVYFTIASQNLQEYEGETSNEIPELAETVVAFQCGRDTAEGVESAFSMIGEGDRRRVSDAITNLNFYNFYMSTQVGTQKRSKEIPARTIDPGKGSMNYSDVVGKSLEIYGEEAESKREVRLKGLELSLEKFTPVEYYVLREVCTTGKIRLDKLKKRLEDDYGVDRGQDVRQAASRLTDRKLLAEHQEKTQRDTVDQMLFFEPTSDGTRELYPRWTARARAGGPDHVEMICRLMRKFRRRGCYPVPLDGEEEVEKLKKRGDWEKVEAIPDLVVFLPAEMGNSTNPDDWSDQIFVAEAEAFPGGEKSGGAEGSGTKGSRTVEHFNDATEASLPVAFGVKKGDEEYVKEKLQEDTEVEFANIKKKTMAGHAELITVDVGAEDTGGNLEDQIEDMRERASQMRERKRESRERTILVSRLGELADEKEAKGLADEAKKLRKVKRDLQTDSLSLNETKKELKEMGVAIRGIKELSGEKEKPEDEGENEVAAVGEEEDTDAQSGEKEEEEEKKEKGEKGEEGVDKVEEIEDTEEPKAEERHEERTPESSEETKSKRTVSGAEKEPEEPMGEERSESEVPKKEDKPGAEVPKEIKTEDDLEAVNDYLKEFLEDSSRSEEAVDLISQVKGKCNFVEEGSYVKLRARVAVSENEEKWKKRSLGSLDNRKRKLFERAGVEL